MNALAIRVALGAAALLAVSAAHANLVVNGGFETGNFTGWTVAGSLVSVESNLPDTGTYYARFGTQTVNGSLRQTIATTAGTTYDVDFWLRVDNFAGITPVNFFSFNWDGGAAEQSWSNSTGFDYTHFTYVLTATSALTTLEFLGRNDSNYSRLDDVTVVEHTTAVPEPSALALVGLGGTLALGLRRRRTA